MSCCQLDSRKYFLLGMHLFFGAWLLYAGFAKWVFFGPDNFVGMITGQFDATWSPHTINVLLAWVIIIAEPLLGLFLLTRKKARAAWTLTSLLMFLLLMGQTILMKPEMIANWQYLVLTLVCASLSEPEPTCCKS